MDKVFKELLEPQWECFHCNKLIATKCYEVVNCFNGMHLCEECGQKKQPFWFILQEIDEFTQILSFRYYFLKHNGNDIYDKINFNFKDIK